MLFSFLQFELRKIGKYLSTKALAKLITGVLFLVVFLLIGVGIYKFFISGFRLINFEAVEEIRLALTLFIYEFFSMILAGLIVFSALVSGLFNLFRSENNNWLMSTPGYTVFPRLVFMKSLFASSLPSLLMFLPAILAFNKVYHLGFLVMCAIVFAVVALLLALNAFTLILLLGVALLYHTLTRFVRAIPFSFKGLVGVLVLLSSALVAVLWRVLINLDLGALFRGKDVNETLSVENISSYFYYLPSHPFSMLLLSFQTKDTTQALTSLVLLFVSAAIMVSVWLVVSPLFYPLWQKFQEGIAGQKSSNILSFGDSTPYYFMGGATFALFKKEALVTSRNMKGVLWFSFLLLIWLIQIGANLILENNIYRYGADLTQKISTLQTFQFIIAIYFTSAFTLRFVFPSFSVEKKTAWILATAPLSFKKIFFGKYFFYASFFVLLGVFMNYLNVLILGVSFLGALYSTLLLLVSIIFVVTLGLSLGALFPNTETDDPEVISTSMPGLFFTALALLYGALAALTLYIALTKGMLLALVVFVVVSIILVGALLQKTPSKIREASF